MELAIVSGDSSFIDLTLTNKSDQDVKVVQSNECDRPISLKMLNLDSGERVRYTGPLLKVCHAWVTLPPGESRNYNVFLQLYKVKVPGRYQVEAIYLDPMSGQEWTSPKFNLTL